uniref:phytanoyl-CoA dioxygenase family protein n=1 Tax=Ningiella ruwaisensis TaxID=2364274 RepID=UPI00109FEBCF|nr:phytanoyl-CoA dioxygenase family protein [Ningiella ruwaisensis]
MIPANAFINQSINDKNVQFYKEYGFLIAPNALTQAEIASLNKDVVEILSGKRGEIEGLRHLSENQKPTYVQNHVQKNENDFIRQYTAIHFPHKLSALIKDFAKHPKIVNVLSEIVSKNVKCLQSMFFVKAPGKKGQAWHQDEYFIPTRDKSLTGAWLALDDANEENGCLWLIPGSHEDGIIRQRVKNDNTHFADTEVADITPFEQKDFVKVEIKKGAIVYFNGYLLHMSLQNQSHSSFRRALVFHYSSAETMLPWNLDGRIPNTQDNRDIFMVTGVDPYAYKGTCELAKPFIRADVLDFRV